MLSKEKLDASVESGDGVPNVMPEQRLTAKSNRKADSETVDKEVTNDDEQELFEQSSRGMMATSEDAMLITVSDEK